MKYFISLEFTKVTPKESELLNRSVVGGVVLFGKNILSYQTTKKFISEIKSINSDLKIGIDEEGGLVSRITHLLPSLSQPYCSTLTVSEVREYYKKRSNFLRDLGIDLNFAPVVDISLDENSYIYKRSYGSDINKIIELSTTCIEEQRKAGLMSCIKHFPGHGRSTIDSHEKLPVLKISLREWQNTEMKIFEHIIKKGVEYVMVGHLLFPKINKEVSSISPYWIKDILKNKLGFKGRVISDDLCMKGFRESAKDVSVGLMEKAGIDDVIVTEQDHVLLKKLV